MIAADGQRCHAGGGDAGEQGLDVGDAVIEAVAAAERHVADVAGLHGAERQEAVHVVIGPDALDLPHRPRPEAGAGPVGDAEVERHADQRHVEPAEVRLLGRIEAQRRAEEAGDALVGLGPPVGAREDGLDRLLELGMVGGGGCVGRVLRAQVFELFVVHDALIHYPDG